VREPTGVLIRNKCPQCGYPQCPECGGDVTDWDHLFPCPRPPKADPEPPLTKRECLRILEATQNLDLGRDKHGFLEHSTLATERRRLVLAATKRLAELAEGEG
jgi:hypothetical protein